MSTSLTSVSQERWKRIVELFHEALDHPDQDRGSYLREACGDDASLYRQVIALIAVDHAGHTLLDADRGLWTAIAGDMGMAIGQSVGPYRLEEELGRGGMGVVYRACREDIETTVALKFLRDRFPSATRLRRFLREQRILGRLDHPGIARLFDAGAIDDGTPFFAMEYVDGVPIPEYCIRHSLSTHERIDLFCDVCDAVTYAHQNLIVHRDLKPSNVLVTDDGQVKLLDFGIAKHLDDDDGLTQTSEHLLTPAYAAPEQVTGDAISTITDVYALGVLLYQVLTTRTPIDTHSSAFAEIIDRIVSDPISPPSEATDPHCGGVDPAVLAGDLDTICLTALAKDPSDRYASASELKDDLQRHLNHRPIIARTQTIRERALKFAQRNRRRLLVGSLVGILLAGLIGFYTLQLREERNRARLEAAKAEQVTAFVTGFFEATRPDDAAVDTLRALTLLRRGEKQIDALAGQPLVQAQMLSVIGDIYRRLGRYADAEPLFHRAVNTYENAGKALTPDAVATRRALGELLIDRSQFDKAGPLLREAVRASESFRSTQPAEYAASLAAFGTWLAATGEHKKAAATHQDVLDIKTRIFGPDHLEVALTRQDLAATLAAQGEMDEAEAFYRDALTTLENGVMHGEATQIHLADLLQDYAAHINDRGRHREAEQMHRRALAIRREVLGPDHPETVISLSQIGATLHSQGRYEESREFSKQVVALREKTHGPMHIRLATALNQLATNELQLGRYQEAEPLFRRVIDIYTESVGADHWYVAVATANLAGTMRRAERYDAAITEHRRALNIFRDALGPHHWQTAFCEIQTARTLTLARRYNEANRLFKSGYRTMLAELGPTHSATVMAAEVGVQLYAEWRGHTAAAILVDRAVADGVPRATLDSLANLPSQG